MNKFTGIYDNHFKTHYQKCQECFKSEQMVMLSLTGSQNYNLDTPESDYDTKLIVLPSWKDIVKDKEAISTTCIMDNQEHIGFTDIRKMMNIFKKQNVNFLEQLFAIQYMINTQYIEEINKLLDIREDIAHYNPTKCIQTMMGIAIHKSEGVKKKLPGPKETIFFKYRYNPKELMHLLRIVNFLEDYISGKDFLNCLRVSDETRQYLLEVKNGKYSVNEVDAIIDEKINYAKELENTYMQTHEQTKLAYIDCILDELTESIFKKYLKPYI